MSQGEVMSDSSNGFPSTGTDPTHIHRPDPAIVFTDFDCKSAHFIL